MNREDQHHKTPSLSADDSVPPSDIEEILTRISDAIMRDPAQVPELAESAEMIAERAGDERSIAFAKIARSWSDIVRFRYEEALQAAQEARAIFGRLGDNDGEAEALNVVARMRTSLGLPEQALEESARALELSEGNAEREFDALIGRAVALQALGRYVEALEVLSRGTAISEKLDNDDRSTSLSLVVGGVLRLLGRNHEALEEFRKALALAESGGNIRFESHALGNIGTMLERLGDMTGALEYHHRSLHRNEMLGDLRGIAVNNNNIALIFQRLGDFASALEHMLRSLAIAVETADQYGEMIILANIGGLYEVVGAHGPVLEYYQRSRAIAEQIGNREGEANALLLIGRYHLHVGDRQNALLHLFRSLRMHEQSGDRYGRTAALFTIGIALHRIGDLERAEGYLREAVTDSTGSGDRVGELSAKVELGMLLSERGESVEAMEILENVLAQARAIGTQELLRRTLEALAAALRASGRAADAAAHEQEAREILRTLFDAESSRRLGTLMTGFERKTIEQHGAEMGIAREDLDEIASVLARQTPTIESGVAVLPLTPSPAAIAVSTFGELQVVVGGRELTLADWKRKRSRDLFKLLLLNYRRQISLDSIVENLGGEIGSRGAELVVMNAVSHIRRALEPDRAPRDRTTYLRHADGAYLLDLGEDASIDFIQFKELIAAARRAVENRQREALYQHAIALYRDDFLKEDYDAHWTDAERSTLRDAWLEAMEFLAAEQIAAGRFEEAIATARTILSNDTLSVRGYEVLLEGLVRRGRHAEAREAAAEMERLFQEELGESAPAGLRRIVEVERV